MHMLKYFQFNTKKKDGLAYILIYLKKLEKNGHFDPNSPTPPYQIKANDKITNMMSFFARLS